MGAFVKHTMIFMLLLPLVLAGAEAGRGLLWAEDFEKLDVGAEPDNVLVLNGEFTVRREEDGNKVLFLPGAPLDTMTVLLDPARREGVSITARVKGEKTGRREPSFGVGLCGASGYRLILSPQRDAMELFLDEQPVAKVDYQWTSGSWTMMKLVVLQSAEKQWTLRGKAWEQGEDEPTTWAVQVVTETAPPTGQASLWGMPYSGKPIMYDDVEYGETTE